MLARKGILVSDPQVKRTSRAQWIWEYISLVKKDKDEREFYSKTLKNTLISVLGLNILPPLGEDGMPKLAEELTEADKDFFTPAAFIMGNHHLLKGILERMPSGEPPDMSDVTAPDDMDAMLREEFTRPQTSEEAASVANMLNKVMVQKSIDAGVKIVTAPTDILDFSIKQDKKPKRGPPPSIVEE